jgi:hypothetical protein
MKYLTVLFLITCGIVSSTPCGTGSKFKTVPLYTVTDRNLVDAKTYNGWKTWRSMACERCHGQDQDGATGPSLNESLKTMSISEFRFTVTNGRVDRGMPSFAQSNRVMMNINDLYAYLKGRSDGAIPSGHLREGNR